MNFGANSTTLKGKHFLSISQLSKDDLECLIDLSIKIKKDFKEKSRAAREAKPLLGSSMSMIFQKRSTRTRVSTETGVFMLGGHTLMLGPQDIQLGANETLRDTACVLSRFNDIILARVFSHNDVIELATNSKVPVINALSDKFHPLQTLADLMTLKEHFAPNSLAGKKLTWVGDGNNVLHDLMIGSLKLGMHVTVCTPVEYQPDAEIFTLAKEIAEDNNVQLEYTSIPEEAITKTDIVVTDTWISMGQEEESNKRKRDFEGFQITADLMKLANETAVFLHCLPRKAEEVSDEVFYSEKSLVFPEAENRMWTIMALTLELLGISWNESIANLE